MPSSDSSQTLTCTSFLCRGRNEAKRRGRVMSARARVDHTENEKRGMRDTFRIERDALLDEQGG